MRENWRDPNFWRWWWRHQVRTDAKIVVAALLGVVLIVGGYFASSNLTGADAASGAGDRYVLQTTVRKVVTVEKNGRTLVRRIPVVVRRSVVRSSTAYQTLVDTRYVTTPGEVRKVVRYVPVVKRTVVRVNGKTTTLTHTLTNVVTNQQTVTNQSTVVVNHTDTVVQPVTTVETKTVTLPPNTVTQTQTVTVTQTQTQTVTTTAPPVTITVGLP